MVASGLGAPTQFKTDLCAALASATYAMFLMAEDAPGAPPMVTHYYLGLFVFHSEEEHRFYLYDPSPRVTRAGARLLAPNLIVKMWQKVRSGLRAILARGLLSLATSNHPRAYYLEDTGTMVLAFARELLRRIVSDEVDGDDDLTLRNFDFDIAQTMKEVQNVWKFGNEEDTDELKREWEKAGILGTWEQPEIFPRGFPRVLCG